MKFDWSASWQTVQRMGTGFLAALPGCGWPSASPSRPSSRTSWPASSFSSRVRSASATRSASKEYEGTVEDIEARATLIKTYDGRRAIIRNGELYTNSVLVDTAFRSVAGSTTSASATATTWSARAVILRALNEAEDVSPAPGADVILVELADFTVNLRARWWTKSQMTDGLNGPDRVLTRVKQALTEAGIDLPYPTQQILVHDQTESTDGDRRRQREGWPAGDGEVPTPGERGHIVAQRGVQRGVQQGADR
jgi:hypothetical protein